MILQEAISILKTQQFPLHITHNPAFFLAYLMSISALERIQSNRINYYFGFDSYLDGETLPPASPEVAPASPSTARPRGFKP